MFGDRSSIGRASAGEAESCGFKSRRPSMENISLKLAIQKNGRLTEETISFLKQAGLEFESSNQRLYSYCKNFPLKIIYARDNDIGGYTAGDAVDLGIVGQNLLYEKISNVKKLLNLRFGFCTLIIAVPKESKIKTDLDLNGLKIATSYPVSTENYFNKKNIEVNIVKISGSVESAPALGISDAVVDLISTGSTLAVNDLKVIDKIYESEAVLIVNPKALLNEKKKKLIDKLLRRFTAVLSARSNKYILMNAPEKILPKLKRIIPGLKSPTVSPLALSGWISVQTIIKEDVFWDVVDRLIKLGVQDIVVLPVEKLII